MSKGPKVLDVRPPPDSDHSSSKLKSKLKSKRKSTDTSAKKSSSKKRKLADAQVGSDSGNLPASKRRRSLSHSESPERTRQENNSLAKKQLLDAEVNGTSSEASQTFSKSKRRRKEKNKPDKNALYQGQEHESQEGQPEPEQEQEQEHELGQPPSTETEGSPFFTQTTSFYLPLSPIAQSAPLDGLCAEHLSPLILTYCPALRGVVLSYSNPRLRQGGESDGMTRAIDEYGPTFIWVTADFTILRPVRDTWLTGYVGVQSASHVGLVCWNLFNASIERDYLPGWEWIHGKDASQSDKDGSATYGNAHYRTTWRSGKSGRGGHWLDKNKKPIEGALKFRVLDFDSLPAFGRDKSFMSIQGTLLEDDQGDIRAQADEEAGQTTGQGGLMAPEIGTVEVQDADSEESSSNESEEYNTAHEDRESVEGNYSRPESE